MAIDGIELRDYSRETELTGRVTRLFHQSERWSAGRLEVVDGPVWERDCSFTIQGAVEVDRLITLHGVWTKDAKWGWQFKATSFSYPMPEGAGLAGGTIGLAAYLANDPEFRGLGPAKARLIADAFGDQFDQAIREDPTSVAEAGKLTQDQVTALQAAWIERTAVNAISVWLAEFGLTAHQIKRIAQAYGDDARAVLESDPYILIRDLDGFGFLRTDQIALKMGVAKDHPGRLKACIRHILDEESTNAGHTWIEHGDLVRRALKDLYLDTLQAKKLINGAIDSLCADHNPDLVAVEMNGHAYVALTHIYRQEMALLDWFQEHGNRPHAQPVQDIDGAITAAERDSKTHLEDAQRAAAEQALKTKISIITGGAGTGKSFTIKTIRTIFQNAGHTVGVCAPTGKAARRLANDAIPASTIHRFLEYNPALGGFTYTREHPLTWDVVVVDEVSMCAVPLLYALISAINFDRTVLVLVGDQNQLPPIGPGNVLRDCCDHDILPVTRLTVCHRNAGKLKENCGAILSGRLERRPSRKDPASPRFEWFVVEDREDPEEVVSLLCTMMEEQFDTWHFDPIEDCQVIVPQHKGPIGVDRLNWELQRVWQRKRYSRDLPPVTETQWAKRPALLPGDKVMQIKNDYKLDPLRGGVMNGTCGIIKEVAPPPGLTKDHYQIAFEDRANLVAAEVGSEQAENLVLAYACTVHKVQGSQYECVVAVVHRSHAYMLSRNLLYTAVTRARTSAIVIGEPVGLRRAVRTITSMRRNTWMALMTGGVTDDQQAE